MPSKVEQFDNLVESYARNPEQGLKFCKKKLQKDPSNSTYLLAQASFLRDLGKPQDALTICDGIKASPKDPLEPGIIVCLQNVVRDCQEELGTFTGIGGSKLAAYWKDALDQCPKSYLKDMRAEMLNASLRNGYWDIAQQVWLVPWEDLDSDERLTLLQLFARLQREFPQNVKFHFAWIALCQLQADKLPADDKTVLSLKMLASRSLKAVVDNTVAKKSTPKILSSSADLRLLYQVYQRQGLHTELIDILDNPDIGITSDVGKNDVEFVNVKIKTLLELKRWKDLRAFCITGLETLCKHYETAGEITQDVPNELGWIVAWQPWQHALTASQEEPSSGSADDVLKLAKRYLEIDPHHRNAGNAVLLHHSLFSKAQLLSSCKTFFEAHSSRVSCFDDLKQVVEGLESEQRNNFSTFLTEVNEDTLNGTDVRTKVRQVTTKTNAMKLRYLLHFSDMGARDDAEIAAFIAQCLEIYGSGAEQEDRPSDDAGILAIAALMKFGSVKSQVYNLQAACLIHLLRDNSQFNFQATLLQLFNARILGLGSIAIAAFRDLKTQEVQLDTLGHLLYTRISTLHPWEVSLREVKALDDRFKNPQASIIHSLQYPRRATNATLDTLTKDLDNIYFDKLYEFLGFNERVGTSFSMMQSRLELQRMRRLTDHTNIAGDIFKSYSFTSSDNRDFGALVDFESASATKTFRDIATNGYKPETYWAVRWQVNEIVPSLLTSKFSSLSDAQNRTIDQLIQYLRDNSTAQTLELTPAEQEICAKWDKLLPIVCWLTLGPKHAHASKDVKQDLKLLTEFLSTATLAIQTEDIDLAQDDRLEFTHFSELEAWYLNLEFAKTCSLFVTAAMALLKQKGHHSGGAIAVDTLNKIKTVAKDLGDAVQKQARNLQTSLQKDGVAKVLHVVKSGRLGGVIDQLAGEGPLRMYVTETVDSAVEAIGGVLKIRVV